MIELKHLEEKTVPVLQALCLQMKQESPAYADYSFDLEVLQRYIDLCLLDDSWRCVIAFDGDDPVGFYAVTCQPMLFSRERTVDDLAWYVLPKYRGGRAGILLLDDIVWWAYIRGARAIRMGATTNIMDDRVSRLLAHKGFNQSGVLNTLHLD